MGEILQSTCSCGYNSENLFVGVGMNFPETKAVYVLTLCENCESILAVNKNEKQNLCPHCKNEVILFDDPITVANSSYQKPPGIKGKSNQKLEERYICPKCKQRNMKFVEIGLWD